MTSPSPRSCALAALTASYTLRRASLVGALVLASLLAQGCMGEATREVLLPQKLKGARVTADGDEASEYKQGISAVIPLGDGPQVVKVEPPGGLPVIVERMTISINDTKAVAEGINVIVAKVDQGMTHRTVVKYPDEPVLHLGHDFEPPAAAEGAILLVSRIDATATLDGKALPAFAPRKGMLYESFVSRPMVVKLSPGKHKVVFSAPGAPPIAADFEVEKGAYELLGATMRKKEKPGGGGAIDMTNPSEPKPPEPPAKKLGPNDPGSRND